MSHKPSVAKAREYYDRHYATGGWDYDFRTEKRWHKREVMKRFNLRPGMRMLEIACGNGFHTDVFNRLGLDCVGIDCSSVGIAEARKRFPKWTYHCCDLADMPFGAESFDVVIARGCSHYHYDLMSEIALDTTSHLSSYLRPGGLFIMIIVTNLSGSREPNKIWHNALGDYRKHFASFGRPWSVDWVDGLAVCGLRNTPAEVTPEHEPEAIACS